jgi:predicted transcriptional regulator
MEDNRNNRGRYAKHHSDRAVLDAVETHEPAATSEVARELDIARQSADYRLRKLREAGRVSSKKIGASLVWFHVVEPDTADNDTDQS